MSSEICLHSLWKIYGGSSDFAIKQLNSGEDPIDFYQQTGLRAAVRDVSLEIQAGEIFVVMGLSGSGKSTLLRMLNGLIEPSSGEVEIEGRALALLSPKELRELRRTRMAMVFQSFALFPRRTALENAAFGLEVAGVRRGQRLERARTALERVGLSSDIHKYPHQLSGGMQQRVGLARALALDPPILLMDEAFSALDPLIRRDMQDLLLDLQRDQRRTIVFISHDLDEAVRIGDRIALMKDGLVLQVGTSQQLLCEPANEQVRLFFRDVDAAAVLQIETIARPPTRLVRQLDGEALAQHNNESVTEPVAVVNDTKHFMGMVMPSASAGEITEVRTLQAGTSVRDAMSTVAESIHPVPVLDSEQRLLGMVSSHDLLRSMVMR